MHWNATRRFSSSKFAGYITWGFLLRPANDFLKKPFLYATLLITSSIQMAEAAGPVFWRKDQVTCGNIVSVRKSGQLPMYDDEYIKSTKSHRQANEVGVVAIGLGVLGPVGAAIASIGTEVAVNSAIDGNKPEPILEIVDPNYNNGNVRAIRIALDDGREINLPVIRNNIGSFGTYAAGDRVNLVLSRQQGVLQIKYRATAKVGADDYDLKCGLNSVTQEEADAAILKSANLVDETLIIAK